MSEQSITQAVAANGTALAVSRIEKSFATGFKLGPLDLTLAPGDTVGLLGKNGAGKTTLFQLLTGNLDATGGEIRLGGRKITPDTPDLKREVGYLPQDPVLPRWATGHEVLGYAASLYGLPDAKQKVREAESFWDCASFSGKALGTLSYGMQKRVALALATLRTPTYLILDEPFSGLDLSHIKALETTIEDRGRAGLMTILSTHVTTFCARLCNSAWVIQAGQLIRIEPWDSLTPQQRDAAIEAHFFAKSQPNPQPNIEAP